MTTAPTPQVLCFDVFGTVADWHGTIVKEMAHIAPQVDGSKFANAWRQGYAPAMKATMDSGQWRLLDELHLDILKSICPQFGLDLTAEQLDHLNHVWHRLDAWPDSSAALKRLKTKFTISPLSNGSIGLLTHMAKRADLNWDVILCSEVFKAYKPDPRTYNGVGKVLEVPNDRVMMVAAHHSDLDAAQDCGLQTAYIERPTEYGADNIKDVTPQPRHPLHFRNLGEVADYFGC